MKIVRVLFLTLLVVAVPSSIQELRHLFGPSDSRVSSRLDDFFENHDVVTYDAKPKGLKRFIQWSLVKLETMRDGDLVSDLIAKFINGYDGIIEMMISSFGGWWSESTTSYEDLRDKEQRVLKDFDEEFSQLVSLRNKIQRRCLYPSSGDDRSLCIEKEMDIHSKIHDLRSRRANASMALEKYKDWISWCASYNNWIC